MKKMMMLFLTASLLAGCSFGGFRAPPQYHVWYYKGSKKFKNIHDYVIFENKEMRSCGMDPVQGESPYIKVNLCLENKGWYLKQGPICENFMEWDEKVCIEWRAKYSKPDVKPWR